MQKNTNPIFFFQNQLNQIQQTKKANTKQKKCTHKKKQTNLKRNKRNIQKK